MIYLNYKQLSLMSVIVDGYEFVTNMNSALPFTEYTVSHGGNN